MESLVRFSRTPLTRDLSLQLQIHSHQIASRARKRYVNSTAHKTESSHGCWPKNQKNNNDRDRIVCVLKCNAWNDCSRSDASRELSNKLCFVLCATCSDQKSLVLARELVLCSTNRLLPRVRDFRSWEAVKQTAIVLSPIHSSSFMYYLWSGWLDKETNLLKSESTVNKWNVCLSTNRLHEIVVLNVLIENPVRSNESQSPVDYLPERIFAEIFNR